jgi:hypothetical protein
MKGDQIVASSHVRQPRAMKVEHGTCVFIEPSPPPPAKLFDSEKK